MGNVSGWRGAGSPKKAFYPQFQHPTSGWCSLTHSSHLQQASDMANHSNWVGPTLCLTFRNNWNTKRDAPIRKRANSYQNLFVSHWKFSKSSSFFYKMFKCIKSVSSNGWKKVSWRFFFLIDFNFSKQLHLFTEPKSSTMAVQKTSRRKMRVHPIDTQARKMSNFCSHGF